MHCVYENVEIEIEEMEFKIKLFKCKKVKTWSILICVRVDWCFEYSFADFYNTKKELFTVTLFNYVYQ